MKNGSYKQEAKKIQSKKKKAMENKQEEKRNVK